MRNKLLYFILLSFLFLNPSCAFKKEENSQKQNDKEVETIPQTEGQENEIIPTNEERPDDSENGNTENPSDISNYEENITAKDITCGDIPDVNLSVENLKFSVFPNGENEYYLSSLSNELQLRNDYVSSVFEKYYKTASPKNASNYRIDFASSWDKKNYEVFKEKFEKTKKKNINFNVKLILEGKISGTRSQRLEHISNALFEIGIIKGINVLSKHKFATPNGWKIDFLSNDGTFQISSHLDKITSEVALKDFLDLVSDINNKLYVQLKDYSLHFKGVENEIAFSDVKTKIEERCSNIVISNPKENYNLFVSGDLPLENALKEFDPKIELFNDRIMSFNGFQTSIEKMPEKIRLLESKPNLGTWTLLENVQSLKNKMGPGQTFHIVYTSIDDLVLSQTVRKDVFLDEKIATNEEKLIGKVKAGDRLKLEIAPVKKIGHEFQTRVEEIKRAEICGIGFGGNINPANRSLSSSSNVISSSNLNIPGFNSNTPIDGTSVIPTFPLPIIDPNPLNPRPRLPPHGPVIPNWPILEDPENPRPNPVMVCWSPVPATCKVSYQKHESVIDNDFSLEENVDDNFIFIRAKDKLIDLSELMSREDLPHHIIDQGKIRKTNINLVISEEFIEKYGDTISLKISNDPKAQDRRVGFIEADERCSSEKNYDRSYLLINDADDRIYNVNLIHHAFN